MELTARSKEHLRVTEHLLCAKGFSKVLTCFRVGSSSHFSEVLRVQGASVYLSYSYPHSLS